MKIKLLSHENNLEFGRKQREYGFTVSALSQENRGLSAGEKKLTDVYRTFVSPLPPFFYNAAARVFQKAAPVSSTPSSK